MKAAAGVRVPDQGACLRALALFLLPLGLTGCDSATGSWFDKEPEPQATFAIDPESGGFYAEIPTEDGLARIRSGENTAVSLPLGFTLYPGAEITGNTVVATGGSTGSLVHFTVTDEPEKVAQYYRKQAEAAGIRVDFEMTANGTEMLGGKGADGSSFSLNVSRSEHLSEGQLMVRQPEGG